MAHAGKKGCTITDMHTRSLGICLVNPNFPQPFLCSSELTQPARLFLPLTYPSAQYPTNPPTPISLRSSRTTGPTHNAAISELTSVVGENSNSCRRNIRTAKQRLGMQFSFIGQRSKDWVSRRCDLLCRPRNRHYRLRPGHAAQATRRPNPRSPVLPPRAENPFTLGHASRESRDRASQKRDPFTICKTIITD